MDSAKGLSKGLHVVLSLLAIVALASGCQGQATAPTDTPTPTLTLGQCTSATLPGHLLLMGMGSTGIHELTCTSTGTIQDQAIVTDTRLNSSSVTISPDGRFLRYVLGNYLEWKNANSTTFEIVSQNLQTGAKHTYKLPVDYSSNDPSSCVSWSPSGTQVSYHAQNGLILKNLITGTHRVLVQEPSQNYTLNPGVSPGQPYFGGIDCGAWISEDILLFHRFTGPFPSSITSDTDLAPNTTTLALLREGTLVDTPGYS